MYKLLNSTVVQDQKIYILLQPVNKSKSAYTLNNICNAPSFIKTN